MLNALKTLFISTLAVFSIATSTVHRSTTPAPAADSSAGAGVTQKQIATSTAVVARLGVSKRQDAPPLSKKKVPRASLPPQKNPVPLSVVTPTTATNISLPVPTPIPKNPPLSIDERNTRARAALVNIFCTTTTAGPVEPITASGVLIDPHGVILTNAHVGQFFLIKDYPVKDFMDCIVRTGSPARPAYRAVPLYISPAWIKTNAENILLQNPTGTGEHDYALLRITEPIDKDAALPSSFPFLPLDFSEVAPDEARSVVIAGYPAGFLGGIAIQRDLYIVSTVAQITNVFTFGDNNTADILGFAGNPTAQHGSSGGAAVGEDGKLLGIISTATEAKSTADRSLHAITLAHISRSLVAQNGFGVTAILNSNIRDLSDQFNAKIAPALTSLLINQLKKIPR